MDSSSAFVYANHHHFSSILFNRNQPETIVNIPDSYNSAEEEHDNHPNTAENIPGLLLSWFHLITHYLFGSTLNSGTPLESVTGAGISNNSIEETHNLPNQLQLSIITTEHPDDEDEDTTNGRNQLGMRIIATENHPNDEDEHPIGLDQSITIRYEEDGGGDTADDPINVQQITRANASIVDPYALTMVITLLVSVCIKFQQKTDTPLGVAKPFMLLIVVVLGIAYASYCMLPWINNCSYYKMLKGLYYIACSVAFIMLLVVLFTTT